LAVGGPDYEIHPPPVVASLHAGDGGQVAAVNGSPGPAYRGSRATCDAFESLRFVPLPHARGEVEEVAFHWSADTADGGNDRGDVIKLTGAEASEAAFKSAASGRRALHVATHAFMLQDRCRSTLETIMEGEGGRARVGAGRAGKIGDNPLLLAGLALAGANRRAATGPTEEGEDGVLTAEEIAALDLSGAEWAVLSACETGVGVVRSGEGVLGLRRAFQVAGVQTLIMSLWGVEDAATREWMRELYAARASGLTTAEALRRAGLRTIESLRASGRPPHPFFWGAFVAAGDWR
jgi:CHAT domain-containing protein